MRAMAIQDAFGIENVKLLERPVPAAGPGQVVLKMTAASLNYRDLATVLGAGRNPGELPLVPLSDGCGEVIEVGEGVTRLQKGDRVAPGFFQGWFSGPSSQTGAVSIMSSRLAARIPSRNPSWRCGWVAMSRSSAFCRA